MNKKDILIVISKGEYSNSDAYDAVLTYIIKKQYPSGYGISIPITRDSCIAEYHKVCDTSKYDNLRYLWHFQITFKDRQTDKYKLLMVSNQIAAFFAPKYQVLYAFDRDTDNDHVHFAVNAYSYYPTVAPLNEDLFLTCIEHIKTMLKATYPQYTVNHKRK